MSKYRFQKKRANLSINPLRFGFDWNIDASVFSSLTLEFGVDVIAIADLTGNGNHFAASSGERPEYKTNQQNGLPGLKSDGAVEFMRCIQNFPATDSDTWFFVYQSDQDGQANGTLFHDYGSPANKAIGFVPKNGSSGNGFTARDANADVLRITDSLTSSPSFVILTREPGKITMNYNGNFQSLAGTYISTTYEGGNYPTLGVQGGGDVPDPNIPNTLFKGLFFEAGRIPRVLPAPELLLLKMYAKNKWGL